ncbi:MAG TPA: MBL fold metallo-hydrolase [Planctomycetota bacterium]|nr:MBL fold metallo-hydrolase [Planctomycetota bacterium]
MDIKFWGVRGGIPTPSTPVFSTSRFGGNTTCVSVHVPGVHVILDGGTGLRALGMWLEALMPLHATFFFSHLHWDHIQGFPFFSPGFVAGNTFDLYGPKIGASAQNGASLLQEALSIQQRHFNFPVGLSEMQAQLKIADMDDGGCVERTGSESTLKIISGALHHPGGCFGYRIEEQRGDEVKSFVFATDTEHLDEPNPSLQKLAHGADLLVYDAQYTVDEYEGKCGALDLRPRGSGPKKGWGHSTYVHGIREARAAGVKRLILTHHDPLHDDWAVARIESEAKREGLAAGIDVHAAYEGMWVRI